MDSAFERAIPEPILATHWHLRLFLRPATPLPPVKSVTADSKWHPTSLDEGTISGEHFSESPCPQLSFPTTIIIPRSLNKILRCFCYPTGHPLTKVALWPLCFDFKSQPLVCQPLGNVQSTPQSVRFRMRPPRTLCDHPTQHEVNLTDRNPLILG